MAKKLKINDAAMFVVPDLRGRIVAAAVNEEGELMQTLRYVCPHDGTLKETVFNADALQADPEPVELPEPEEFEPVKQTVFVDGEQDPVDGEASAS